ncbi:spore germination protein KA [Pelagirhabdus alkalitolerans]|uniref:Spore germination protein KA n=1 Tax=Pelagirhabdus alkalitolerans TaxID=1612202 RepID=A0A1G6N5G5_9BACI|nr:spore germination protein [Pelagirhabdus alkalitolerans]SDC63089.1 spore germination protein KA [Pelagirhabdus alkalitolerans]
MRTQSDKKTQSIVHDQLSSCLKTNLTYIKEQLGHSTDLVVRHLHIGSKKNGMAICYLDGLVEKETIRDQFMSQVKRQAFSAKDPQKLKEEVENLITAVSAVEHVRLFNDLFKHLMAGDSILLIDQVKSGLIIDTKGGNSREIDMVTTQEVVRGPKEGFVERLESNIALVRRRLKDRNFWLKSYSIGTKTQTTVVIGYLNGIVNPDIVKEVEERLSRIKIDAILESGNIEEFIQDDMYSPFPTVYNSERPDAIAAGILEGKVAIFVDGTPFVLLVPTLFVDFLKSSEDYYQRSDISTMIRCLRVLAFFIALLTPSFYIAVTLFHQEMLPTTLLTSLAAQREGIPFPAFIEALIMEVTFELLREAGVRLPSSVGSAISIVGALVLGQAAVEAGIVSPMMVIVVSFTAISSFVFPSYNLAISIRMLRFVFMMLAASFGLYGIFTGFLLMVFHLASLRSFGIPYLFPLAPFSFSGQRDVFWRAPLAQSKERPHLLSQINTTKNQTEPSSKKEIDL